MAKIVEDFTALRDMPVTALILTLIATGLAMSGKFNVMATQILFFISFIIVAISVRNQALPVLLGVVLTASGSLLLLAYWARPDAIPSYLGRFDPKRIAVVSSIRSVGGIRFGTAGMVFSNGNPQGSSLVSFMDQSHLRVEIIDHKIAVSINIFDPLGKLVAEVVRNEWKVAPSPATWDLNYNNEALEILNPSGLIALQVILCNDIASVQGEFYGTNGKGVRLVETNATSQGSTIHFVPLPNQTGKPAPEIKKIFLYPSSKHLGKLLKPNATACD